MDNQEISQEEKEENDYDDAETRAEINAEIAESYGAPSAEEKINQYKITSDAIHAPDPLRTTYLSRAEVGKPQFSVRFYLDCAKIAKMYNAKMIEKYFL